ncbi:MAG: hypothetical protein HY760_06185 [Nitrospirae bacterium]|nr:hypothetical protein [Nitrospirota bacterium]
MKTQKRLGKGLREISHCFITPASDGGKSPPEARGGTGCRVILILDDLHPVYSAALGLSLALNGTSRNHDVLLLDGVGRFPRLSSVLGVSTPGIALSHFQGPEYPSEDWVAHLTPQLRIFLPLFRLQEIQRMKDSQKSAFLRILRGDEARSRMVILRLPPGEEVRTLGRLPGEIIVLVPEDPAALVRTYHRIKEAVSALGPATVGTVVAGSENPVEAHRTFRKFQEGAARFLGVTTEFLGSLPRIPDTAGVLREMRKTLPFPDVSDRVLGGWGGGAGPPTERGSLQRFETLFMGSGLTWEERRFFS